MALHMRALTLRFIKLMSFLYLLLYKYFSSR